MQYYATVDVAFCFLCYKAVKQGKLSVIYDFRFANIEFTKLVKFFAHQTLLSWPYHFNIACYSSGQSLSL